MLTEGHASVDVSCTLTFILYSPIVMHTILLLYSGAKLER